ncbi:MAG: hypothetical protein SGJ27_30900 [Candidatus Melainabacteria bacterium]|nr:hypothetical protein [Candidatus Melainabacteria bacterium]
MKTQRRREAGNVLIIILVCACFIIVPLVLMLTQTGVYVIDRGRVQTVVDGAGLLAANDLSKMIINDRNFGFVSLSNYPPIGRATLARDGEPLPVIGINTLVGTIRQNTIVAHELGNSAMLRLADVDRKALDETTEDINSLIKKSLNGTLDTRAIDIQGKEVDPLKSATEFINAHLPGVARLESIELSNGWLKNGGMSTIKTPEPQQFAQLKPNEVRAGEYKAFMNVPAFGRPFTFAGLGPSSRIVSNSEFEPADNKHINTIVKIDCVISQKNPWLPFLPAGSDPKTRMRVVAYCQPYTMPDLGPKGLMTLRFSGQPVAGLLSWNDFLKDANFADKQVATYDVIGGDYPIDKGAALNQTERFPEPGTAEQFGEHLYYWLRNGHLQPRLGEVLAMVNAPFKVGMKDIYAYEFAKDGTISRRLIDRDPFPVGATADSQYSAMADTRIQGGLAPIILFRDNVKNLGTENGGKHGGQPLAGNPLNWCELRDFGGDEQTALYLGKGRLGTQLTLTDPANTSPAEDTNMLTDLFRKIDGKPLSLQPRRNFYSGGLALDIEIGGIRQFQPPTLDIPSKRMFLTNRKI